MRGSFGFVEKGEGLGKIQSLLMVGLVEVRDYFLPNIRVSLGI